MLVRIEAYKVLARNHDPFINTHAVAEKFAVDIVPSKGPPIVYATRTGVPRIALIGTMPETSTPVMYSAMNDRLTISSREVGTDLTIFYRTPAITDSEGRVHEFQMRDPIKMVSRPDLDVVVERLGGIANDDEKPLNFTYSEVVAILSQLSQKNYIGSTENGIYTQAQFKLEDPPSVQNLIYRAPSIDTGRPQGDDLPKISQVSDPAADAAMIGRK
jgi:hypothetical protein